MLNISYSNSTKLLIWKVAVLLLLLFIVDYNVVAVVKAALTTRDTSIHVTYITAAAAVVITATSLFKMCEVEYYIQQFAILDSLFYLTNKLSFYVSFQVAIVGL